VVEIQWTTIRERWQEIKKRERKDDAHTIAKKRRGTAGNSFHQNYQSHLLLNQTSNLCSAETIVACTQPYIKTENVKKYFTPMIREERESHVQLIHHT